MQNIQERLQQLLSQISLFFLLAGCALARNNIHLPLKHVRTVGHLIEKLRRERKREELEEGLKQLRRGVLCVGDCGCGIDLRSISTKFDEADMLACQLD